MSNGRDTRQGRLHSRTMSTGTLSPASGLSPRGVPRSPSGERMLEHQNTELTVKTESGRVVMKLPDAVASWTRADIVQKLQIRSPLPSGWFYKVSCGDRVLGWKSTVGDCIGLALLDGDTPVFTVVELRNDEQPTLDMAFQRIRRLADEDVRELGTMRHPLPGLAVLTQVLCTLFGVQPVKAMNTETKEVVDDFLAAGRKVFFVRGHRALVDTLAALNPDSCPERTLSRLAPFVDNPAFGIEKMKSSKVTEMLCAWCHALYKYCKFAC